MAKNVASFGLRVGLKSVKAEPPPPARPTGRALAACVKQAIEREYPYFAASVRAELLDK